ncbi:hypothetical protein [Gemmata obscuriglobus]|uniref:hypothetical protein n=1 Tax=Gemmata obscuriglobus TaxID=114 RepID=UPI00137BAB02|nr:hypothetical protein [Gemmata obscuriglobus]VTS08137.1 unnamed protein product [Gemmata obscuriglobus UQM 2246]
MVPFAVQATTGQTANLGEYRNSSGTARAYVTPSFQGVFEGPGTSTGNVVLGINAGAANNYNNSVVIGNTASVTGNLAGVIAIGQSSTVSASGAIAIGQLAQAGSSGIAIGGNTQATLGRQVMIGSGTNAANRSAIVCVANAPPTNQTSGWFTWTSELATNKPSFIAATSSASGTSRTVGGVQCEWATSTDASRLGRAALIAFNGDTIQEGLRVEAASGAPLIGVFGSTAVAKQTVTGSRGGNAALASLLTALANFGWITDSTTA